MIFFVTGATGGIGAEVTKCLLELNHEVRALIRDPSQADRLPDGVTAVVGDLDEPDSLRAGLQEVDGAFVLPGFKDMSGLYSVFEDAGISHVLQLSGRSAASADMTNAITEYMVRSETAAKDSKLGWTIIRPSAYMSNTFRWIEQAGSGDVVLLPFASVPVAMIDPNDIGEVAAAILTAPKLHTSQTYELSGPEALLPEDTVRTIAQVIGKQLKFEPQSDAAAKISMTASMPKKYVDALFDFYVNGKLDESGVLPTVEELTGKKPKTFQAWADSHSEELKTKSHHSSTS